MTRIDLKNLNWTNKRLKSGKVVRYYYAWRGGPRLPGKPGSPEFAAAYMAAVSKRRAGPSENLADLVRTYQRSPEYATNSDATRREWGRWLDKIAAHRIGEFPIAGFSDPRVKKHLLDWRDEFAKTSLRNADYALQVLSAVLSWGVGRGIIAANPVKGTPQLYASDRADIIWTEQDLKRFGQHASTEVSRMVRFACLTGLRRADLVSLVWGEVRAKSIVKSPSKAKVKALPGALKKRRLTRRAVIVPILPEAQALLDEIGRGADDAPVFLNTKGRAWSPDGLENRIVKAKTAAGLRHLHLHDTRGTFITMLAKAGIGEEEIAKIVGWSGDRVKKLMDAYVDHEAVVLHIINRVSGRKT